MITLRRSRPRSRNNSRGGVNGIVDVLGSVAPDAFLRHAGRAGAVSAIRLLGPSVMTVDPTPGTELFRSRPLSSGDELVVVPGEIEDRSVKRVETTDGCFVHGAKTSGHGDKLFCTCSEALVFRSSSRSTTADRGTVSVENRVILCSTPSSSTRNSFWRRSPTRLPCPSFTVTGTTTSSDRTVIVGR